MAYERTNRSRFSHLGFLGLNFMNLLQRTWATGAMPLSRVSAPIPSWRGSREGQPGGAALQGSRGTHMGAPGWPELALKVASAWDRSVHVNCRHEGRLKAISRYRARGAALAAKSASAFTAAHRTQRGRGSFFCWAERGLTARTRIVLMASLSRSV